MCVLKISMIHSVAFETTATISNTDHMKNTPQSPACAPQIEEQYRWQSCTLSAKDMSDIEAFQSRMQGARKKRRELRTRKYAWIMWKAANTCLQDEIHQ